MREIGGRDELHHQSSKHVFKWSSSLSLKKKKTVYNSCLSIEYFPTVFKEAIIKFIPKTDKSPLNPTNYRPISLLEVPGEIFERLVQARRNTFLFENNIIEGRQHGFRTYKGTNTTTTTYETIANALADKKKGIFGLKR